MLAGTFSHPYVLILLGMLNGKEQGKEISGPEKMVFVDDSGKKDKTKLIAALLEHSGMSPALF